MTDVAMSDQHRPVDDDEDIIMHDASMLPTEESDLTVMDPYGDPMDISPIPMSKPSTNGAQPKGTVLGHTNPSSPTSRLPQNDVPLNAPKYNLYRNITRSPFIRVAKRFSPKSQPDDSNPYLSAIDPAKSVLRPVFLQNRTPIKDPIERMKRMFRSREKAPATGDSSEPISEHNIAGRVPANKTVEQTSASQTAGQSSETQTAFRFEVEEAPASFEFPFKVPEPDASRKRCYNEGPAHPCNYQLPEVAGHVNTKYRRVSINDFPSSAIKANDKEKRVASDGSSAASPTTARNEPSPRAEPTLSARTESPHSSSTHDHHTSSDRVTDVFAQNSDHTSPSSPIATSYRMPGAWPESPEHNHMQSSYISSVPAFVAGDAVVAGVSTAPEDVVMTDDSETPQNQSLQNEDILQSMEIDGPDQNTGLWHGYCQAAYQGTTKAVGTLLNYVRDAFSSTPSFGPVVDMTWSIFRRRRRGSPERRRGSRESSPIHQQSPTRVNLRSLPEEQRHKIRCHKWRSERGMTGPVELPFPELHIEFPAPPVTEASSSQTKTPKSPATLSASRAKNPKFTHRQKDKHAKRRNSRKAKGRRSTTHGVHKRSGRATPRKQSTATSSPQRSQAWVQPMSPNVHRRVFFANTPPKRYPELAAKERQWIEWRNSLGGKRQKEIEAQLLKNARPAAAARQEAKGPAGTSSDEEATKAKKLRHVHFAEPLETEIAPHLHPATPHPRPDEEQKENIAPATEVAPVTEEPEIAPEVPVQHEAPEEGVSESETDEDPWLRFETPFGRPVSAVRLFYPDPKPLPAGRTESIYAPEWREIEEKEKRDQRQTRIRPNGPAVRPLGDKWEDKVAELRRLPPSRKVATTLSGDNLHQKDLATCYTPMAWLNDEVINSYLALIIEYLRRTHNNAGRHDKPKFHAFNSFFFSNLRDKGYESVRRWASRAKIGGESLLDVDTVFVPVHSNAHWTLLVVKPMAKTIEHFDSLGPPSRSHIATIKAWLREELGPKFRGDQWTALPSRSPQQNNGSDCGAFLLSTAKAVAIGLEPLSYGAADIPLLRRRIVAELMAGRLEGEFDPSHGGEVLL